MLDNPLLAESLRLANYVERMDTGTRDIILRCREAGLAEPEYSAADGFVTTVPRKSSDDARKVTRKSQGKWFACCKPSRVSMDVRNSRSDSVSRAETTSGPSISYRPSSLDSSK